MIWGNWETGRLWLLDVWEYRVGLETVVGFPSEAAFSLHLLRPCRPFSFPAGKAYLSGPWVSLEAIRASLLDLTKAPR